MDHLWTPWRYNYVTGAPAGGEQAVPKGVPLSLAAWPGPDTRCVFCNLIGSVQWAIGAGLPVDQAEEAGHILVQRKSMFVCLNAFPYASGHVLVVPYRHVASLAELPEEEACELMLLAQEIERSLRAVYTPDGINLGMNLGAAAGAGVAGHLHMHMLPRWMGDTNFMTVTAETRVLPEMLAVSWRRLRSVLVPAPGAHRAVEK